MIRTGFDREIPGFRRYRLVGNESLDEYHLEIVNSTLEDEAVFQCQVTPAGGDAPLLGIAHLTVTGTSYLIVTGTSYLTVTGTSYLTVTHRYVIHDCYRYVIPDCHSQVRHT